MEQQQGIRRRFTHILTYSIGMCRSKHAAESPSRVSRVPVSLPSRLRKPRLADLFSADSDTISSTTRCEKFDSDKTWFGSEADRASMSHLSPFEYETCDDDAPRRKNDTKLQLKTTAFETDYYRRNSCSSSRRKRQEQRIRNRNYSSADARSDSDIASSLLVELSNSKKFPESSVCSNEPEPEIHTHKQNAVSVTRASGKGCKSRPRRKQEISEVGVKVGSMAVAKRSVDPYEDFRRSMVEMIVEKEMFGREELEELLMSFLALNSADHHKIIVLVFVEILEIVFSNSSSSSR